MDAEGELDEIAELIGLKARLFGEDLDMDIAFRFSCGGKDSASDAACSGGGDGFFKEEPEVASFPARVFEVGGELKAGGRIKEAAGGIVCAAHELSEGLCAWLCGRFLQGRLGDIDIEREKGDAMIHAYRIDTDGISAEEVLFRDVHGKGLMNGRIACFSASAVPLASIDAFATSKEVCKGDGIGICGFGEGIAGGAVFGCIGVCFCGGGEVALCAAMLGEGALVAADGLFKGGMRGLGLIGRSFLLFEEEREGFMLTACGVEQMAESKHGVRVFGGYL